MTAEQAQIDEAVAVIRRHRAAHAVPLGMPAAPDRSPPVTIATISEATA